jgi:hypothetical protein
MPSQQVKCLSRDLDTSWIGSLPRKNDIPLPPDLLKYFFLTALRKIAFAQLLS